MLVVVENRKHLRAEKSRVSGAPGYDDVRTFPYRGFQSIRPQISVRTEQFAGNRLLPLDVLIQVQDVIAEHRGATKAAATQLPGELCNLPAG